MISEFASSTRFLQGESLGSSHNASTFSAIDDRCRSLLHNITAKIYSLICH